jgi:hypothetical protein
MCLLGILVLLIGTPLAFVLLDDLMFSGHFLKRLRTRMGITE